MALDKITYSPGDILTAEQMNKIQDAVITNDGNIEQHFSDVNPHNVTAEQTGAATKEHKHSTDDITSGTLPVARGGTGNTTVDTTPTSGSTKMVTSGGVYAALAGKANSSHGNHVPTTQTASNKKFLRNDNTWQDVTPANIGAVPTSRTVNGKALSSNISLSADDVGAAKIATGSYIGTDKYGSSNPNTITCPFVPKFILIGGNSYTAHLFPVAGVGWSEYHGYNSVDGGGDFDNVTLTNKTVMWYTNNSNMNVGGQMNDSGTYQWVAFG